MCHAPFSVPFPVLGGWKDEKFIIVSLHNIKRKGCVGVTWLSRPSDIRRVRARSCLRTILLLVFLQNTNPWLSFACDADHASPWAWLTLTCIACCWLYAGGSFPDSVLSSEIKCHENAINTKRYRCVFCCKLKMEPKSTCTYRVSNQLNHTKRNPWNIIYWRKQSQL